MDAGKYLLVSPHLVSLIISIDLLGNTTSISTLGRHDPCVGIRATPIAEAMLSLVLIDHALRNRGQNSDVVTETPNLSDLND